MVLGTMQLIDMLIGGIILKSKKDLKFSITQCDVEGQCDIYWKVLNRGLYAQRRDMIRGQISSDKGHRNLSETTNFNGDHFVECYIIQSGVVIAPR